MINLFPLVQTIGSPILHSNGTAIELLIQHIYLSSNPTPQNPTQQQARNVSVDPRTSGIQYTNSKEGGEGKAEVLGLGRDLGRRARGGASMPAAGGRSVLAGDAGASGTRNEAGG